MNKKMCDPISMLITIKHSIAFVQDAKDMQELEDLCSKFIEELQEEREEFDKIFKDVWEKDGKKK